VLQADKITTPLMLVHGDQDFIPIQQAEEFFTALYRQDKRARLMRYQGEGHTIAYRANVLDLWQRMANWLAETLASRP
jgi:dipeptidyl aminopeptidase/acylaminoacyl peptidase